MKDNKRISIKFGEYEYLKLTGPDSGYVLLSAEIRRELDEELLQRMIDAVKHTTRSNSCEDQKNEIVDSYRTELDKNKVNLRDIIMDTKGFR